MKLSKEEVEDLVFSLAGDNLVREWLILYVNAGELEEALETHNHPEVLRLVQYALFRIPEEFEGFPLIGRIRSLCENLED